MRTPRVLVFTVLAMMLSGASAAQAETYLLTSLADSVPGAPLIPGTLRDALSQGNRVIKSSVKGQISVYAPIVVAGDNIRLDVHGLAAPGLTLNGGGLVLAGNQNVLIRGLRIKNTPVDGVQVRAGACDIQLEHLTVRDFFDGGIDITDGACRVTVSDSYIQGGKHMLIKYGAGPVGIYRTVFTGYGPEGAGTRSPQACQDDECPTDARVAGAPEPTVDMRNNVIANWFIGYGTLIWRATANIINNVYSNVLNPNDEDALTVFGNAEAYTAGNLLTDTPAPRDLNVGTRAEPFPVSGAPYPMETCQAARNALRLAGVRHRDAGEQAVIDTIDLGPCQ